MSEATPDLPATAVVDPDLVAGQDVGEYRVEAKIGAGRLRRGVSAVHPLIGKVVAIKVLPAQFSVDPEMVSRFVAEARAVNQIRHRNIIDIFSFGQLADGRQYYVMELLDGETLDALLERERPAARSTRRCRSCARSRARSTPRTPRASRTAISSPRTCSSRADADGGAGSPSCSTSASRSCSAPSDGVEHKTRTGVPMGTPYYMSPEQCRGRDVDHRTDIYSFGVRRVRDADRRCSRSTATTTWRS